MSEKIHVESIEARLARLEERMQSVSEQQDKETTDIETIKDSLNTLLQEFSRYKGFVGGVLLILSSLAAAIKTIPFIGNLFTKQ